MRSLCCSTPEGIRWRDERSYMLIENIKWSSPSATATAPTGEAVLTGVVRGRGLKADRLVHVPEWGDFQIQSIYAAPLPSSQKKGKAPDGIVLDEQNTAETLDHPTEDQDDLATIAPEEVIMTDEPITSDFTERKGVLLDDHHYFSDGDSDVPDKPKRLPKGTSTYQAAWYLDDIPDSDSDIEDEDKDGDLNMGLTDTLEFAASTAGPMEEDGMTEAGPSEYPKSEAFIDRPLDEEMEDLETYRAGRKDDAKDDLEFPDEIELHPNVLASERLAKYRGLKSLKSSNWNTSEDKPYEPPHWRQLLQLPTYAASKHKAVCEALVGGVAPGTRVFIHLRLVPLTLQNAPNPLALFSLLRHEHKHTACNFNITLSSSHPTPLKSKDPLILQVGPRRLKINPIFSSADNTPNNVHKFDRYLHPGRNAIASFIGPLTWGSVPCLVFQASSSPESSPSLSLIATGTTVPPSPSRVITKRAILTGHPYKIHKKLVTVRYMFFNASDVAWFKALQLWTRRGRSGFIKESLGTHGYFKATFDGKINPMDAVAVSLYKRVWPREATMWIPSTSEKAQAQNDGGDAILQDT
jgi:pre-rRNA-processing protein TSR1